MAINYATLLAEVQLPAYAADLAAGNLGGLAAALNVADKAVDAATEYRKDVSPKEVQQLISSAEVKALAQAERDMLQMLLGFDPIDASNPTVRAWFAAIFPAGATRTALDTMAKRALCSRAEQLFGTGTVVSVHDLQISIYGG